MTTSPSTFERSCAVCGSGNKKILYRQRFAGLSTQALLNGYTVTVCNDCGFGSADHLPDQRAFDEYYRDMSKYEQQHSLGGGDADLIRCQGTAELLARFLPDHNARILDIGCATGRILGLLKRKGYGHVLGVDPSTECCRLAHELYEVEVRPYTIASMPEWREQFDAVMLISVVEHVQTLHPLMERLAVMLPEGGTLLSEHPDAMRFSPNAGGPFQEFSTEHVNFFSRASLSNLLRQHGFAEIYSIQEDRQASKNVLVPSSSSIFRKDRSVSRTLVRDADTERRLTEYIRQSQELENGIRQKIDFLVDHGNELVVWGVGTHTQHLMETTSLSRVKIVAFIDSNPRYQGKELNGIPILSPQALRTLGQPVLISSRISQDEIVRQMREGLCVGNEAILLY